MAVKQLILQTMRRLSITILLLAFTSMLNAGAEISEFHAYPDDARIILQWSTTSEVDMIGFDVQRSANQQSFMDIGFIQAQGSGTGYTFIDDSIIAKVAGYTYRYRLKVRNMDGSTEYSEVLAVESKISSVQHSWGSLKALFK
jgi:hypothetical protein